MASVSRKASKTSASPTQRRLIQAAADLAAAVDRLRFASPITHVYNPLTYAWPVHEAYLQRYGSGPKKVVFLGMNPGPFGMTQTGVPFGEIDAVRRWLQLQAPVGKPSREHPKRPVQGFACHRSEVSGRRLWGLFADRFKTAPVFFRDHFVVNYCPLAFLEESGRNFTPDKLPAKTKTKLLEICDRHLREVISILQPRWAIGVGDFAQKRLLAVFEDAPLRIGKIAHPSPASPAANRDWAGLVTGQLQSLGVWRG